MGNVKYRPIPAPSSGGSTTNSGTVILNVPCDSTVYVGAVVRMDGLNAVNAIATDVDNARAIGIVEDKPTSTTANIRVCGFIENTSYSFSIDRTYFLSDSVAGAMQSSPPTTSGYYVVRIGKPITTKTISIDLTTPVKRA